MSTGMFVERNDGELVEIGMPMLGSCFGHDVFIGADVYIGPGRIIPNGIKIIADSGKVVTKVSPSVEAGKTYLIRNGELVAVD